MGCCECRGCIENENENEIKDKDDNNRKKGVIKDKGKIIKNKEVNKDKDKDKFNYLKLNDTLEGELEELLKKSVKNKKIDLNANNVFEREDVQKENKDIITKIKKQLTKYKSSKKDYLMERAIFLKKVGYLIRFSHEIAIYTYNKLFHKFKEENGIHSLEKDTIRLYFSSWIKELFNEKSFESITKKENIYAQVKDEIENKINSDNELEFLKKIFPDIIKLYFHCFLADIEVNIIYAIENEKFVPEYMIDILLTGLEDDKNILFTFLPGLYCNGQYFENSYIYVTTYPINNRNKFPFDNPVFKYSIESDIIIEVDELNPNFNYKKKDIVKNGRQQFEFFIEPDINWDKCRYYFFLIDSDGKKYIFDSKNVYIPEGNYEIPKISINGKKFEKPFGKLIVKISNQKVY
jgi:hypothetical protein